MVDYSGQLKLLGVFSRLKQKLSAQLFSCESRPGLTRPWVALRMIGNLRQERPFHY
jgi:hypothetical protein